MTTPNFKNSQLGITVSPNHPNVGIGISSPSYTLDVAGSGRFTEPMNNHCGLVIASSGSVNGELHIGSCSDSAGVGSAMGLRHSSMDGVNDYMIMANTDGATFVSAKDTKTLTLSAGGHDADSKLEIRDGSLGFRFNVNKSNVDLQYNGDNENNVFYIDASADSVGIGTDTPAYKLDVIGTGRFVHSDGSCGLLVEDTGGSGIHIGDCALGTNVRFAGIKHSDYNMTTDYMIVSDGTDTYISAKDSGGSVYLRPGGNAGEGGIIISDVGAGGVSTVFNEAGSDRDIRMEGADDINLFRLDAGEDRIGIGLHNPSTKLHVSGVITASGGNSTNWNTAYSWGDHSTLYATTGELSSVSGYLQSQIDAGAGGGTDTFVTGASFSDTNGVSEITLSLNSGSDITVNMNTVPVVETGSIGQPFHPGTGLGHIDRASYIPVIYQSAFGSVNSYPPILKQSDIYQRTVGSQDLISINPLEKDIDFELGGDGQGLFATCAHTNSVVIGQGASASSASTYAGYGIDIALINTTYIFSGQLGQLSVGGGAGSPNYTFPISDGSAGQALVTDGSGSITFSDAHPNISAASSVNNSGGGFIQDITVDSNGHVTGMTSATAVISNTGLAGSAASLSAILNIVTISSGDYAGLSSKNANTLYFVL